MVDTAPIEETLLAGIELGGTKCIVLLARGTDILRSERIATSTPDATLAEAANRLDTWRTECGDPQAFGIASFGPLGLDRTRAGYGHITDTPKAGWANTDLVGFFAPRVAAPIGFDTDVAGAALAEYYWGAGQGADVIVYLTVGTGIGGGVVVGGKPLHGAIHPEIGHIRVRRRADDSFAGICPFHADCLEGLCSGPAIAARSGLTSETAPADHPVWNDVTSEMAELMATLLLTLSPQKILLGGGVFQHQQHLLTPLRTKTAALLNGYVAGVTPETLKDVILPPMLGDRTGPLGAVALARQALQNTPPSAPSSRT